MKISRNIIASFLILSLFLNIAAIDANFPRKWKSMQDQYRILTNSLMAQNVLKLEPEYCLPCWKKNITEVKQLIKGPPNKHFILHQALAKTMVRRGWSTIQDYEQCYLEKCLCAKTKELLSNFSDTPFTLLPFECKRFKCSTNTLVHLYYAARALEALGNTPVNTIVEFGGGFGNLARVFKMSVPKSTVVIIDLPELLAIQYLFLTSTLSNDIKIIIHSQAPEVIESNAIHLIPIYIAEKCNINADLFISTFALTESPATVQKLIFNKKFFNAKLSYIVGQLGGWRELNLADYSLAHTALRNNYKNAICEPSYLFFHNIPAYEMIAMNN